MPASDITPLNGWDECKDPEIVYWKRVRRLIEHEDLLVNHRVTWLLLPCCRCRTPDPRGGPVVARHLRR